MILSGLRCHSFQINRLRLEVKTGHLRRNPDKGFGVNIPQHLNLETESGSIRPIHSKSSQPDKITEEGHTQQTVVPVAGLEPARRFTVPGF